MVELHDEWGVWYLPLQALFVALTALIPPFPSEVLVIASGAMASAGALSLTWVLIVTTLGCLAGDLVVYLLFRYQLIRVLYRWRWGRRLHRGLLRTSLRAGGASTWIGLLLIRWMPGGRTTSMATAAMMGLSGPRITALAVLGALIWSSWLIGLGYITGTTTGLPPWASTLMGIGIGTLVGLIIALLVTRRRRRRPLEPGGSTVS
ncbi:DedA family protein [Nesterenkonia muleiensis]|uniref:DedA family protein n=1 Tax=Nesterenkonia muleiensis TaxID=2282648 RepID=UPI000E73FCBF|nr:VTT domain-containing protein [Nesterenkonia muleiensis]